MTLNSNNKVSNRLSTNHTRGFNDATRTSTDMQMIKDNNPAFEIAKSDDNSLQLSTASVPSEMEEDDDLENMTEEGILEKLIALPSNSDEENDLNKVSDKVLKQKKKEMDREFEQHQLKPGDDGYEYDKEVNFDGDDKVSCGWDSNSGIEDF